MIETCCLIIDTLWEKSSSFRVPDVFCVGVEGISDEIAKTRPALLYSVVGASIAPLCRVQHCKGFEAVPDQKYGYSYESNLNKRLATERLHP